MAKQIGSKHGSKNEIMLGLGVAVLVSVGLVVALFLSMATSVMDSMTGL